MLSEPPGCTVSGHLNFPSLCFSWNTRYATMAEPCTAGWVHSSRTESGVDPQAEGGLKDGGAPGHIAQKRQVDHAPLQDPVGMGLALKSCLIGGDSKLIRLVARKILEDLEFQTEEATDGQVALEACRRKMPSAFPLEWNVLVKSGTNFLRALRALPGGETPRVL